MFFMSPTAENEAIKGTGQSKGINQKKTVPLIDTDKDGKITNTATYTANPQNPNGFQEIKRVDRVGASHNGIPTPHVHENGKVRPAKDGDL